MFYNGVTLEDIHSENRTNVNGIQGTQYLMRSSSFVSSDGGVQHGPKKALLEEVSF